MAESVPRYPLEWPSGWARRGPGQRRHGAFRAMDRAIGVESAVKRLEAELGRLGARGATLSTNLSLRLDGRPRGDETPKDPGAAVYFDFKGRATVLACDTYWRVADNIAALAAHIEHLRAIERHGVGTIEQALAGYKALPADTAQDWRTVFGFVNGSRPTVAELQAKFKELAKQKHPDRLHDDGAAMAHLNRARDYAIAELGG